MTLQDRALSRRHFGRGALIALTGSIVTACFPKSTAAVSLKVKRAKSAPKDAAVYIDEEFIGPLAYVAARGVRLPIGEHRITVEREGYFPWDKLVVADRYPVKIEVEMRKIPD